MNIEPRIDQSTAPAQSPFLPDTNIQFAWFKEKAEWLVANAINNNGCLESHLAPNAKGYVPISFGRANKWRAHRVVYFASNPNADQSLLVCHSCDNRRCMNIDHLFLGTAKQNSEDMVNKGRQSNQTIKIWRENGHVRKGS